MFKQANVNRNALQEWVKWQVLTASVCKSLVHLVLNTFAQCL